MDNPLDNMEIANGQAEKKYDLDAIFGRKQTNPFKTKKPDEFRQRLELMSYIDMQALAQKVGVDAFASAPKLRQNLLRAFTEYCQETKYNLPPPKLPQNGFDITNPEHRKVMAELGMVL